MIVPYKYITLFLIILSLGFTSTTGFAYNKPSKRFAKEFQHLKEVATSDSDHLDTTLIDPLISYVASDAFRSSPAYHDVIKKAPSAYHGFTLKASMKELLKFCYNSKIPGTAVAPEHIRLTSWKNIPSKHGTNNAELWELIDTFKSPVIKKGILWVDFAPITLSYTTIIKSGTNIAITFNINVIATKCGCRDFTRAMFQIGEQRGDAVDLLQMRVDRRELVGIEHGFRLVCQRSWADLGLLVR